MNGEFASIERGEVISVHEGGYKIASYSRDGLITAVIPAIQQDTYAQGDQVYFFMFDDGHGAVLGRI